MRLHSIKLARGAAQDFSDLTTAKLKGAPAWALDAPDVLELPFDREPTPEEKVRIRRRLVTPDKVTEDRVAAWSDARAALRQVKGLTPPLAVVVTAVIALLDDKLALYGE